MDKITKEDIERLEFSPELDLDTLRYVDNIFNLHSDHSCNTNGYRSLKQLIEKESDKIQPYKIVVDDVREFRSELMTMIEQLLYSTGKYSIGSSSEIAERFEHTINSKIEFDEDASLRNILSQYGLVEQCGIIDGVYNIEVSVDFKNSVTNLTECLNIIKFTIGKKYPIVKTIISEDNRFVYQAIPKK